MTIGNWITIVVCILGLAATWGTLLNRVGRNEKDVEKLAGKLEDEQRGRERQGERIGQVEVGLARLEARSDGGGVPRPAAGHPRRATRNPGSEGA